MEVKPIRDNVLVKRSPDEGRTAGGLIVVQNSKPSDGIVSAVGEGGLALNGDVVPLKVSIGDRVFFRKGSGVDVTIDGEEYVLLTERDIFAVVV